MLRGGQARESPCIRCKFPLRVFDWLTDCLNAPKKTTGDSFTIKQNNAAAAAQVVDRLFFLQELQ